jgi:hypothetical protein
MGESTGLNMQNSRLAADLMDAPRREDGLARAGLDAGNASAMHAEPSALTTKSAFVTGLGTVSGA